MVENKLVEFFLGEGREVRSGRVLLAVSGGADSVALLRGMVRLREEGEFAGEIFAGHVNHNLRGAESEGDAAFVRRLCGEVGVELFERSVDVMGYAREGKVSVETAARELRRGALGEMAEEAGCGWIATGHHANDNAETVVGRLARGTGYRGICGIWPVREIGGRRFVSPLLHVTRGEIADYLRGRGLAWREDSTNAKIAYRRNFIRHLLLPEVQKGCGGDVVGLVGELAKAVRGLYGKVREAAEGFWERWVCEGEGEVRIDGGEFAGVGRIVQVEVLLRGLARVGCGEGGITRGHLGKMIGLADGGGFMELPGGFAARGERGDIVIFERRERGRIEGRAVIEVGKRVRFGDFVIEAEIFDGGEADCLKIRGDGCVEYFDLDRVAGEVCVRGRREGDRFVPLGMGAEKKVGKFLTDEKVLRRVRERVLIVEDGEKVLWVWPVRMSGEAKVGAGTKRILRVEIRECKGE